jgi:hypothetical protein
MRMAAAYCPTSIVYFMGFCLEPWDMLTEIWFPHFFMFLPQQELVTFFFNPPVRPRVANGVRLESTTTLTTLAGCLQTWTKSVRHDMGATMSMLHGSVKFSL